MSTLDMPQEAAWSIKIREMWTKDILNLWRMQRGSQIKQKATLKTLGRKSPIKPLKKNKKTFLIVTRTHQWWWAQCTTQTSIFAHCVEPKLLHSILFSFLSLAHVSCVLFFHLLLRPPCLLLLLSRCIKEGKEVQYIGSALESCSLCVCERMNESVCIVKPNCYAFEATIAFAFDTL